MLSLQEISQEMADLSNWSLETAAITKEFTFVDFKQAIDFVNKIGEIAEKIQHHPDIMINYNVVRLSLSTHSANGLTKIDFQLAREIDKI